MRLVLDTNTARSGLLWDGPPSRLIEAAKTGIVMLFSSVALLTELRTVLSRRKFSRPLARRDIDGAGVFRFCVSLVTIVAPAFITPTIKRDPTDDAVLATALGARADIIVAGDAHLPNLKSFQGIEIVTAAMADSRIDAGS